MKFFGWTEIACWMWTGERQSTKMRIKYLEAALSQDIQYFDTQVRSSDIVFAINTDAALVQDAISEKVKYFAFFISYLGKQKNAECFSLIYCSWVVSFTTWQLL